MAKRKIQSVVKPKYRDFLRIRNYSEHKCFKVRHNLKIMSNYVGWDNYDVYEYETEDMEHFISSLDQIATGRYTFDSKYFYLENEIDAIMFKLRF